MRLASTALFLACSWFWCLGGFFPVLLIDEFGREAFFFFFLFNVVGAAAFGFVWNEERRQAFLARNRRAAQLFSLVVAGYHVVFIVWISALLDSKLVPIAFLASLAAFWGLKERLFPAAVGLFLLTLVLFGLAAAAPQPPAVVVAPPASAVHAILPMALGFGLAPYFDLTFHRAFARYARPRLSFALGFGLAFGVLLAGVYFSVGSLGLLLQRPREVPSPLMWLVAILVLQGSYTTAAHLKELAGPEAVSRRTAAIAAWTVMGLVLLHVALWSLAPQLLAVGGALVYRVFLFVIGGLFPLLILFPDARRDLVAGAALLTPCYGLGFLVGGAFAPFLSVGMAGLALLLLNRCLRMRSPSRV